MANHALGRKRKIRISEGPSWSLLLRTALSCPDFLRPGEAETLQSARLVQLLAIQEALARTQGIPTLAVHNLCSFYTRSAPTGNRKDLLLHTDFCWCLRTRVAARTFVLLNCVIQAPSFK